MAVIQISRIQVRRGVADLSTPSGLPQLASGEIGWAVDQQRLWIGSGSVEEGAPAVENVEIVTVPSLTNILATFTASNYIYRLNQGSGGGSLGATSRSIQAKLDDRVSAADFNIVSETDVTASLQNALNKLYVDNTGTTDGPVLEFPPAQYNLTATIYIPPNAKLQGIPGKTSFTMLSSGTAIFQTMDINKNKELQINGSVDNISIKGLSFAFSSTFTTTWVSPMLLLDKTSNTEVSDCIFSGTYDQGYTVVHANPAAIKFRYNIDSTDRSNIVVNNNRFENVSSGIYSIDDISNVKIINNKFVNNYKSIWLLETTASSVTGIGPTNISITENYFEKVLNEGVYVGASSTTTNIVTNNNVFRDDVGRAETGGDYLTPVITFKSLGNLSTNDTFERFENIQPALVGGVPSTPVSNVILPMVDGGHQWQTRQPLTVNINVDPNDSSLVRPLVVIPFSTSSNAIFEIDYVTNTGNTTRTGKLTVNQNSVLGPQLRDEFISQGVDAGTYYPIFSATKSNNSIVVGYLTDTAGSVTFNVKTLMSAGLGTTIQIG
jgi:hypothetical protein